MLNRYICPVKTLETMKYLVRALKYYVYYFVLLAIILLMLHLLHLVDGNIEYTFRNGWTSVWQIAIMFAVVAAAYPYFGFRKHGTVIPGSYEEIRPGVMKVMESKGYELEREEGENLTFRLRNRLNRVTRMWEDRITFTRDMHGFIIEGPNRDVVRIKSALEYSFRNEDL